MNIYNKVVSFSGLRGSKYLNVLTFVLHLDLKRFDYAIGNNNFSFESAYIILLINYAVVGCFYFNHKRIDRQAHIARCTIVYLHS